MQVNVTQFLSEGCMRDYSASVAEIGNDAGPATWQAALDDAPDYGPHLDTPEKIDAMRQFARSSGGWTDDEVAAWTSAEVNALFLQWVAGDARECGLDRGESWAAVRQAQEIGNAPSNLWRDDDGQIWFDIEPY